MGTIAGRALAPSELIYLDSGVVAAFAVECRGPLDTALLGAAFAELARQRPILRTRVADRDGRPHFTVGAVPELEVHRVRGPAEPSAVDTRLDPAVALARPQVVRGDGDQHVVALLMQHAIADGPVAKSFLDTWWDTYTRLVTGEPLPPSPAGVLPGATEDVLAGRYPEQALDATFARRMESMADPAIRALAPDATPTGGFTERLISWDAAATGSIVAGAHAQGLSPYALACGAVMRAERALLEPATGSLPMACVAAIDLRSRTGGGEVPALAVTNLVATHRSVLEVAPEHSAADVGRALKRQLDAAIEAEEPHRMVMSVARFGGVQAEVAHASDGPMLSHGCVIIDWGRIPPLRTPPPLRITGFRGVGSPPVDGLFYAVFQAEGCLTVQLTHPRGAYSAGLLDRLCAEIERRLSPVPSTVR